MSAGSLRGAQRGLTLIELIIFIVVVLVGLAGVLTVLDTTVRGSADPVVRKQALALAEAMLEEVLAKDYQNVMSVPGDPGGDNGETPTQGCTPTTAPRCLLNTQDDRGNYNDVDDFNTWSQAGDVAAIGAPPPALAGYTVTVTVGEPLDVSGVTLKTVTVRVTRGAETVTLQGWRGNF